MADENPPASSDSPDETAKTETIRITLPPKTDQTTVKRETVRINVPGKPGLPPLGTAPKKETTKLPSLVEEGSSTGAPAAAGGVSKPFIPPPPGARPLPTTGGVPAVKPLAGTNMPPKPPTLGARPTVPLKPTPGAPGAPAGEAVTQKAAAPKKETARITLPPEGSKPSLPKPTVKMQQTQPLVRSTAPVAPAASFQTAAPAGGPAADSWISGLSWAAFILALAAGGLAFLVYQSANTPLPV